MSSRRAMLFPWDHMVFMLTRRMICGLGLILYAVGSPLALADSSSVYEYYLSEGIKAFEKQDYRQARRYLASARRVDPSAEEPIRYLKIIWERERSSDGDAAAGRERGSYSLVYQTLLRAGQEAFERGDYSRALQSFYRAHLLEPGAPEPLQYINLIKRSDDDLVSDVRGRAVTAALDQVEKGGAPSPAPEKRTPSLERSTEAVAGPKRASQSVLSETPKIQPSPAPVIIKETVPSAAPILVSQKKDQGVIDVVPIVDIIQASPSRPLIKIELGSSVIIEGQNIQKFLAVDQGFLQVEPISRHQLQVTSQKRGSSFLHVWDDRGRSTIYVEVILSRALSAEYAQGVAAVEHAQPFRMIYSSDWSNYYYGNSLSGGMRRTERNFEQHIGTEGETPYGFLDASATLEGFAPIDDVPTYTLGLSGVPFPGTSSMDLRFFDASRYLSPLTLPGTYLRGAFADVTLFENRLGVSYSHGEQQPTFGLYSGDGSSSRDSYIDAGQIALLSKDPDTYYAVNYAVGSGSERDEYLSTGVYSIEGHQRIDRVILNAELARDMDHNAGIAGLQYENNGVRSTLNVRDIHPDFTTITSYPSNQGEVGATWAGTIDREKFSADAVVDTYRDRVIPNPRDQDAYNYDTAAHARVMINEKYWTDSTARYIHTPGELSPRRYVSQDTRLYRNIPVWGGKQGTAYVGGSYQKSRFAYAPTSEYDRCAVVTGVQLPLTKGLTCYASYEYSWLHEPASGGDFNPNVMNLGVNYFKELNDKLSGNMGMSYRDEQNIEGVNSFLAGEDSVSGSAGLSYHPSNDVNFFVDGRVRDVRGQVPDRESYNDLDIRFGVRMAWGVPVRWDPQGIVGGYVFKDRAGDGWCNVDDDGIPNVKVKVGDDEVITDENGWYQIQVRAKQVTVTPLLETIPAGFIFSTPTFSQVRVLQGRTQRVDFGLTTKSGIYGIAFVDTNGNGAPDRDERLVAKVKLSLDGKHAQMTDSRGTYFFSNITDGKHVITLDVNDLPKGVIPLVKLKNEINVAEGTTYVFHVPVRIKEAGPEE